MAALKYRDEHNKVGFLEKPKGSADYHQVLDFLRGSHIRYAITHDPIIYDSLVKQFWSTASLRASEEGPAAILATIDRTPYTITEPDHSHDHVSTPPRPTTTTSSALVNEQGPSSDPNIASSSRPHESAPDLFTSTNVEDESMGGSFQTSPPRSTQAPPEGTTSGGAEDLDKLTALSSLVSTLVQKVNTQESDLNAHKLLFKEVVGKLVKKVKLLEDKLKGRKRKFVLTDSDKEEDAEQDVDPLIKLAKAAAAASAVPTGGSHEADIPTSSSVPTDEFAGGSDVPAGVTTGSSADPSNKGKSPLVEEDPPVRERTFRQREEDRLGVEAARRMYEEEQAELEREREELQKKRQQDVLNSAKYYTDSDWTDIMGQVHANQGLNAGLLGSNVTEDNFAERMVALIAKRRREFAVQRFKDKLNKPMTYAQQKAFMRTFVKNQSSTIYTTGWTMKHVKSFSDDQLKTEFDKIRTAAAELQSLNIKRSLKRPGADLEQASSKKSKSTKAPKSDVPADSQQPSLEVPSQKATIEDVEVPSNTASTAQHTGSSPKKVGTRKKRLGRKGVHPSHSTIPIGDGDPEAEHQMCIKYASDVESDSDDDTPVNFFAVVDWELLPMGLGWINVFYRKDNSRKCFTSLREILHLVTRADLMTIYGRVMSFYQDKQAAGVGLVLWGDLKVLMDSPEVNDGSVVWKNQHTWSIQSWKLFSYSGVHVLETDGGLVIHMFVDKKYPLSVNLIERMLDHQLEICHDTVGNDLTTVVQLIAFLKKQISDSRRPKKIFFGATLYGSQLPGHQARINCGMVSIPSVVPTGKDNGIVSTGRSKVIPAGSTILFLEWSTFVKTFSVTRDAKTFKFKTVQEAARKDIERAFGSLRGSQDRPRRYPALLEEESHGGRSRIVKFFYCLKKEVPFAGESDDVGLGLSVTDFLQMVIGADPLYHFCSNDSGNFTRYSSYDQSLNKLLGDLYYKTPPNGFANAQWVNTKLKTFGLSCGGDVSSTDCKTCIVNASAEIRNRCPSSKAATIWYNQCILKYSNRDFFGKLDNQVKLGLMNTNNASDPMVFNLATKRLLSGLSNIAYADPKMYAAGVISLQGSQKLYGSVQCTRDLSSGDCMTCLNGTISALPSCCDGKKGARIVTGKGSLDALEWAIKYIVGSNDTLVVLGVLPEIVGKEMNPSCLPFNLSIGNSGIYFKLEFSTSGGSTPSELQKEISRKKREYQKFLEPYYEQCKKRELDIELLQGSNPNLCCRVSTKHDPRWIVLDGYLKKDKIIYTQDVDCHVALLKTKGVATLIPSKITGPESEEWQTVCKKIDDIAFQKIHPWFPRTFSLGEIDEITNGFNNVSVKNQHKTIYRGVFGEYPVIVICFNADDQAVLLLKIVVFLLVPGEGEGLGSVIYGGGKLDGLGTKPSRQGSKQIFCGTIAGAMPFLENNLLSPLMDPRLTERSDPQAANMARAALACLKNDSSRHLTISQHAKITCNYPIDHDMHLASLCSSLQHLPHPATFSSLSRAICRWEILIPGDLCQDKLKGKARKGFFPERLGGAHRFSVKLVCATVNEYLGRHVARESGLIKKKINA
ncbi:anticodon-binding aminoacyl-tRNA synthetase, class 1a [Tanacetum coccineum]